MTPDPKTHPLRVGLNLLYLLPGKVGGTETYAFHLASRLAQSPDIAELHLFVNRSAAKWASGITGAIAHVAPVSGNVRTVRYLAEQLWLPNAARRSGIDVIHSLGYTGPLFCEVPHVITALDTSYLEPIVEMGRLRRWGLKVTVPLLARTARHVIAISQFTAASFVRRFGLEVSRVTVVPLGADGYPEASQEPSEVYERGLFVVVGGFHRYKNVDVAVRALGKLAGGGSVRLVITGRPPALALRPPGVEFSGYLSESDLRGLIQRATAVLVPSRYEGFGLPVVEAQAIGTPVLSSNAASLPEVAGAGAVLLDPDDVEGWAREMERLATDTAWRAELSRRGRANAGAYRWEDCAEQTTDVYRRLIGL
jgi:glycosyltransferase involved in cell wall biosynthesis